MQKYVNVRSTAPEVLSLETDDYHVILNKGIKEIHEEATEEGMAGGFNGFEIEEQLVYEKDEYIALISKENTELGEAVNSILTDIIPNLLGE
nr:hypothetical protein [uncultured Clostridium sp.]